MHIIIVLSPVASSPIPQVPKAPVVQHVPLPTAVRHFTKPIHGSDKRQLNEIGKDILDLHSLGWTAEKIARTVRLHWQLCHRLATSTVTVYIYQFLDWCRDNKLGK